MDTSNWRPTEGGSGDSSMESSDWRAQLQADSRKKMVNRIMDALKSHVQVSGYEGRQEVEKMAVSFEENVYVAATSQSEYTRKICFKILTIETRSQNPNSVNPSYPAIRSQNPNIVNPSYPAIVDWRVQLQADSRQRIVNKIMDTLKRHLPFSGPEGLQELKKIAVRFEDKVYSSATSQSDYLRTLSLKMLTMETRSQNPIPDPGSQIVRPVNSQGQPHPNHPHPTQQPLSQAMHTNIGSTEKQESADWRSQLHADTRQKIVNKLMDSLKMRIPFGGHEGLHELEKIAVRFEEKIYTTATSQPDYFRKISLKMLTMETRSQNPIPDLM